MSELGDSIGRAEALGSKLCEAVLKNVATPAKDPKKVKPKREESSLATLGWIVGGVAIAGVLLAVNPALSARVAAILLATRR